MCEADDIAKEGVICCCPVNLNIAVVLHIDVGHMNRLAGIRV